jgi:hypothetical protein
MKNTLSLFVFLSLFLITVRAMAQCPEAERYVSKIQQADSWSPTERASSGKKISAWTQLGDWYNYRCECENGGNLSDDDLKRLVDHLNLIKGQIAKEYSAYGSVPNTSIANCKKKGSSNSSGSSSGKSSTQIEMENRFRNYNNAMNLKEQGENIAKAYAQQVKSYGELNSANSPEALLQNFNSNMQAIADLQTQNKADNLNQLTNTLNSTINDLNSGNHEGAMFSALSLLDQGDAKREARREAERVQQNLIYQTQEKMTAFYMKALELNDQAIKQYNEKAAYAYSKEEENYLLEYVSNLECHKESMKTNFSYSNASWTQNRCAIPKKKTYTVNNLIAKDIQYVNAAKRKYALYEKTGESIFQQGAMRFAGLAATENPKADYYYIMGHFAGINNPLVAYSSFLTVKSKNTKFFEGDKKAEYSLIKLALEAFFKTAIDENNQEVIKNIVGAGLHQSVEIDENSPIIYAMKVDQADVVFAFLNTELKGKPQRVIKTKVQSALFMSAILDAPNTIQKFVDLGFSIDFSIDGKTPLDIAEESLAIKSFDKISELLGGQSVYAFENSDAIKVQDLLSAANVNDSIKVRDIFQSLKSSKSKFKAIEVLLHAKKRNGFFTVYEKDKKFYSSWAKENRNQIFKQFCEEVLYKENKHVYRYLSLELLPLADGANLAKDDLAVFFEIWFKHSWSFLSMTYEERIKSGLGENFINNGALKNRRDELIGIQLGTEYSKMMGLTGSFTDDWNEQFMFEYLITNPNFYKMNLLDFAIYNRQDSKMVRVLLDNYNNKSLKTENLLFEVVRSGLMLDPSYKFYRQTKEEQHAELMKNGYEILDMLIFDFGYNQDAFKLLANMKFDNYLKPEANQYLKTLIDKLIETGQANKNWNMAWHKDWKKQKKKKIKKDIDQQYWNAILDGDYESRYK